MGEKISGKYCGTLVETGKPLMAGGLSFVLPRGSNWTMPLSAETLQLRQENAFPTLNSYLSRNEDCNFRNKPSLSLKRLQLFFFIAYAACFVIFLEMIFDPQTAPDDPDRDGENENKGIKEKPAISQMVSSAFPSGSHSDSQSITSETFSQ